MNLRPLGPENALAELKLRREPHVGQQVTADQARVQDVAKRCKNKPKTVVPGPKSSTKVVPGNGRVAGLISLISPTPHVAPPRNHSGAGTGRSPFRRTLPALPSKVASSRRVPGLPATAHRQASGIAPGGTSLPYPLLRRRSPRPPPRSTAARPLQGGTMRSAAKAASKRTVQPWR